jgi:hypothetical protein
VMVLNEAQRQGPVCGVEVWGKRPSTKEIKRGFAEVIGMLE